MDPSIHPTSNKLIESFARKLNTSPQRVSPKMASLQNGPDLSINWIHFLFTGKKRNYSDRVIYQENFPPAQGPCKFTAIYNTTKTNIFVNLKDRTEKELQSGVVYKFNCQGCQAFYISKSEGCLAIRLQEHPGFKE